MPGNPLAFQQSPLKGLSINRLGSPRGEALSEVAIRQRLVAILAADAAGYSHFMAREELADLRELIAVGARKEE